MTAVLSALVLVVAASSCGAAAAHEAGSSSSPPPLPNIISQLINLYRIALSQKTTARPLPPLSPSETAAALQLSDTDHSTRALPPPPSYLPPPPFFAPPRYFPPLFGAPPPPTSNPSEAFDPSQMHLSPSQQPYPRPQTIPLVGTQQQETDQPQSVLRSQPAPQRVFSPPRAVPRPHAASPRQYSTPPAQAEPQVDVSPPVVYYVSSETVNRTPPAYYSDPTDHARRPDVAAPATRAVASTHKHQVNYQYAPSVQTENPQAHDRAAARGAQYAQATRGAQAQQAAQPSFVQQILPTPEVMPPNQLSQTPTIALLEVSAQPQAAPPQAYAAAQLSQAAHPQAYAVPPQACAAPPQAYATPTHAYAAPPQAYAAAPAQAYAAPQLSQVVPPQAYAAPAQAYVAPAQAYAVPQLSQVAPSQAYSVPQVAQESLTLQPHFQYLPISEQRPYAGYRARRTFNLNANSLVK